jgi:cell division protein FtsB
MTRVSAQPSSGSNASKNELKSFLRRIPLNNLQIILIALAIVGGRLVVDFGQRIVEGQKKIVEQRALEAEIAELKENQQELETTKAYYSSPAYVEAWAHNQGKMVRPGEILVIPEYDKRSRPGTSITSAEPVRALPPWNIWWSLFFDDPPPFSAKAQPLDDTP